MALRDKRDNTSAFCASADEDDEMEGMTLTPVISIEPSLNWAYDALLRKWVNIETGEIRATSPSDCGEDSPEDYPQARVIDKDTFFLTPQQIRAGVRLDIDDSGQIRACPACGKRQVVIENGQQSCADAAGESPSCGFGARSIAEEGK